MVIKKGRKGSDLFVCTACTTQATSSLAGHIQLEHSQPSQLPSALLALLWLLVSQDDLQLLLGSLDSACLCLCSFPPPMELSISALYHVPALPAKLDKLYDTVSLTERLS